MDHRPITLAILQTPHVINRIHARPGRVSVSLPGSGSVRLSLSPAGAGMLSGDAVLRFGAGERMQEIGIQPGPSATRLYLNVMLEDDPPTATCLEIPVIQRLSVPRLEKADREVLEEMSGYEICDSTGAALGTVAFAVCPEGLAVLGRCRGVQVVRRELEFTGTVMELYGSSRRGGEVGQVIFVPPGDGKPAKAIVTRSGHPQPPVDFPMEIRHCEDGYEVYAVVPYALLQVNDPSVPFLLEFLMSDPTARNPSCRGGTLFGSPYAYNDNTFFAEVHAVTAPLPAVRKSADGPYRVGLDERMELPRAFEGFTAEWDPGFWSPESTIRGNTEDDWQLVLSRVGWMRPAWVRMMMYTKWWLREDGTVDWDSPHMRSLYRYLDYCQESGIRVFLSQWEPHNCARTPESYLPLNTAHPRNAWSMVEGLDHLIRRRGYTCITHFILFNEPNNMSGNWDAWLALLEHTRAELETRGLSVRVKLLGPDSVEFGEWLHKTVLRKHALLDAYDVHRYALKEELLAGDLERGLTGLVEFARRKDPRGWAKPFYVTEAGTWPAGTGTQVNPEIKTYVCGLEMADYAVQTLRAGVNAVSAWMMEDSNLPPGLGGPDAPDYNWGLWGDKREGFAFRPWFYTWSLLIRLFPAGCVVYRVAQPEKVRLLAARKDHPDGRADWSFCCVNRRDQPLTVALILPVASSATFQVYEYSENNRPTDDAGFPMPVRSVTLEGERTLRWTLPPVSAVFLTQIRM